MGDEVGKDTNSGDGTTTTKAPSRNTSSLSLAASEVAVSDIGADAAYKASWTDLFQLIIPDAHYIALAFCFLLLAALAQVYIPKFTGNILDALVEGGDKASTFENVWQVPGFQSNICWLMAAAVAGGAFSGIRGSIFQRVGGRVNAR